MRYEVRFPPQPPGGAEGELIEVAFSDGRTERLRLHDYERVFTVPGLYEEVVQRRLGCRSPDRMAEALAEAAARLGWEPGAVRILDAGAGNGVSGEAFAARGLRPVVGLDILPAARAAALRDRPGLYGTYLVEDITALPAEAEAAIRAARPNVLACVGSVGAGHLPPEAVAAGLELLEPDALVVYGFDAALGPDPFRALLAEGTEMLRERGVHRRTVTGGERHLEAVVTHLAPR